MKTVAVGDWMNPYIPENLKKKWTTIIRTRPGVAAAIIGDDGKPIAALGISFVNKDATWPLAELWSIPMVEPIPPGAIKLGIRAMLIMLSNFQGRAQAVVTENYESVGRILRKVGLIHEATLHEYSQGKDAEIYWRPRNGRHY